MFAKTAYLYFATAVLFAVGVLLPWLKLGPITVNGTDADDGTLMFVVALLVVIAGLLILSAPRIIGAILGGLASLAGLGIAIYDIHSASTSRETSIGTLSPSPGSGLFVCVLAAVVGLFVTIKVLRDRSAARV